MIQRKQTVYYLLAGILSILLIFAPLASLKFNGQEYLFTVAGIKSVTPGTSLGISTLPLMILLIIIAAFNFIVIFLYKNRALQMKMSIFNLVFTIGLCALIFFHLIRITASEMSYSWGLVLPVVCIILIILAYLGVKKDDKLVKSLDRIR